MQDFSRILFFALAGIMGAWSRYAVLWLLSASDASEWGVFIVNILGCFGFGLLFALAQSRLILLVGFMGSFTTFSSYIFDAYKYIVDENWMLLIVNSLLQLVLGLLALRLGLWIYAKAYRAK